MKKKHFLIFFICFFLAFSLNAWKFKDLKTFKTEKITKELTFKNSSQINNFEIDNVFGKIHLTGYNGKTVKISAVKTIRAINQTEADKAQKKVRMDLFNDQNGIRFYIDGPWRDEKRHCNWDHKKIGYIVQYDFVVKVPKRLNICLKTVMEGDIKVKDIKGKCVLKNVNDVIIAKNITGDFDIKTVNGKVLVDKILGSGHAHTINGSVNVNFVKNPLKTCSFHSMNGNLNINFCPDLNGNFKMKTFTGKMYSDYPSIYLPAEPAEIKQEKGKFIYKNNGFRAIQIGKGGPEIKMDTFNGNIYINQGE